ncbi:MAG: PHP domain-containing protein, partial [Candidatus Dadabacteria bacterium]|nr:PHP domain-containing protein [Candidatus Dadabacteria bacterium]
LVTRGYFEGFYRRPRVDHEMLSEHNEGLIVLSGCMSSELSQAIFKKEQKEQIRIASIYKEIFGDRYYLEVQAIALEEQRRVNRGLRRIGERLGIKLAATNDCHFLAAIWHRLISLPGNRIIRKSISSYPRRLPYMTTGICPALTIASPGLLTKQLKLGGLSKTPYSKKL